MSNSPDENYRPQFTAFLSDSRHQQDANLVTWHTIKLMNDEMVRNNVPMTQAHFEAATRSLLQGDTICRFLAAENQHVLLSNGSGFVYQAGFVFHGGLSLIQAGQDAVAEAFGNLRNRLTP